MNDICEHCGHPEHNHMDDRCLWCEEDAKKARPDAVIELCPGFKPDIFNMWKEDNEGNRSPEPTRGVN